MEIKIELYGIDLKVVYDLDEDYIDEINEVKVKGEDILDLLEDNILELIKEEIYIEQARLSDER